MRKICKSLGIVINVMSFGSDDEKVEIVASSQSQIDAFSKEIGREMRRDTSGQFVSTATLSRSNGEANDVEMIKSSASSLFRSHEKSSPSRSSFNGVTDRSADRMIKESPSSHECTPFQVNSLTVQYVEEVCREKLRRIEDTYFITLVIVSKDNSAGTSLVTVAPSSKEVPSDFVVKGHSEIRDLCTRVSKIQFAEKKMLVPKTLIKSVKHLLKLEKTSTVIECNKETGEVCFYGSQANVDKAAALLRSYLGGDDEVRKGKAEAFVVDVGSTQAKRDVGARKPRVHARCGDITKEEVEVIVCGSNRHLHFISGTARAIRTEGGLEIEKECQRFLRSNKTPAVGAVVVTRAGDLRSKRVFHAIVEGATSRRALGKACLECLRKASAYKSIALPALGSRMLGFSKEECVSILLDAVDKYREELPDNSRLNEIVFVDMQRDVIDEFERQLKAREARSPSRATGSSASLDRYRESSSRKAGDSPRESKSSPASNYVTSVTKLRSAITSEDYLRRSTSSLAVGGRQSSSPPNTNCAICMSSITNRKALPCGHGFCRDCIDHWFQQKPSCPTCFKIFGEVKGTQPEGGEMNWDVQATSLPGYEGDKTIRICYRIPSGTQSAEHPHPGRRFSGTSRTAYLPDNKKGRKVLKLLHRAFRAKLIFTIGQSRTTGGDNQVTWNDIHHKTTIYGGTQG